jgi:hypothetical protein
MLLRGLVLVAFGALDGLDTGFLVEGGEAATSAGSLSMSIKSGTATASTGGWGSLGVRKSSTVDTGDAATSAGSSSTSIRSVTAGTGSGLSVFFGRDSVADERAPRERDDSKSVRGSW